MLYYSRDPPVFHSSVPESGAWVRDRPSPSGVRHHTEATRSGLGGGLETLRKLEQGHVEQPGVFRIAAIADALETTVDALLPARPNPAFSRGYEGCEIATSPTSIQAAGIDLVADVRLHTVEPEAGVQQDAPGRGSRRHRGGDTNICGLWAMPRRTGHCLPAQSWRSGGHAIGLAFGPPRRDARLVSLASWRQEHHVALLPERDEERCHRSVVLEEPAQLKVVHTEHMEHVAAFGLVAHKEGRCPGRLEHHVEELLLEQTVRRPRGCRRGGVGARRTPSR